MTDEQWLWLFVNQSIDNDEKLEHMCPKCQSDATSNMCIRCGKPLDKSKYEPQFVNPNFDTERFNALSNGTEPKHDCHDDTDCDGDDYELFEQIMSKCKSKG